MKTELRFTPHKSAKARIEKRSDGKNVICGYASVFYRSDDPGTEYDLGYGMRERISPGAFNRALAEGQDVVCRFDHQDPLGRSSSGTLTLKVDGVGLYYEVEVPDTVCGRDTSTLIDRGDVPGSSFAFRATSVEWIDAGEDGEIRQINDCDLFDVGPVMFPAYTSTTTGVRSTTEDGLEAIKSERDEWRSKNAAKDVSDADAVDVAMSLARLE